MDLPFGHHKHHHQARGEQEEEIPEERPRRYPPAFAAFEGEGEGFPPPSSVYHEQHVPGFPTRREEHQQGEFGSHHGFVAHESHRPPQSHSRHQGDWGGGSEEEPPQNFGVGSYDYAEAVDDGPRRLYQRPPPPSDYSDPRPPPYSSSSPSSVHVQHVAHETFPDSQSEQEEHRHNPFSFFHRHSGRGSGASGGLATKPTVRVFCQAEENYSLTIRDGKVVLARADPSDEFQHWIKDEKYSTKVKDEEGFPSFALVHKATGQALKHSIGATHPVQLCPYDSDILDESVLWTESKEISAGFRAVRMVNNIRLNFDAFNGDKNHGGVHDGTILVLWEWKKGENQRWKIAPY